MVAIDPSQTYFPAPVEPAPAPGPAAPPAGVPAKRRGHARELTDKEHQAMRTARIKAQASGQKWDPQAGLQTLGIDPYGKPKAPGAPAPAPAPITPPPAPTPDGGVVRAQPVLPTAPRVPRQPVPPGGMPQRMPPAPPALQQQAQAKALGGM